MPHDAATDRPETDRAPRATYRLQFSRQFTLADAQMLAPYLKDLGISHIYASPLQKASPGSMHGYDICDFRELNPEIGTPEDFAKLDVELKQHHLGLILDVVPNHMGISGTDNHWWQDVLEHGQASRYAGCFDIDWQATDSRLRGKVAMPILSERYHDALRRGTIFLVETAGTLGLKCVDQNLPVSPQTVSTVLQRIAKSGRGGESHTIQGVIDKINGDPQTLDEFIKMQNYLLMYWRNGDATLNYRRFFTITSLAGLRIEDEWVFDEVFGLIKQWIDRGWVDGLRVGRRGRIAQTGRNSCAVSGRLRPRHRLWWKKSWSRVSRSILRGRWMERLDMIFSITFADCSLIRWEKKPLSDFYTEFTGDATNYPGLVRAKKQTVIHEQLAVPRPID